MTSLRPAPDTEIRHLVVVLFGFFGGAAFWAAHLGLSYYLVPRACVAGQTVWLHLVTLLTVLGAAAAAWVAYGVWRRARRR